METVRSEDVQHGLHSWNDYDRPWILRRSSSIIRVILSLKATFLMSQILGRQFLVSQYHASIFSNLVAIALTLAGPRLWTLLKALVLYVLDIYTSHSNRRNRLPTHVNLPLTFRLPSLPSDRDQNGAAHRVHFEHDSLNATETSHSELGAAMMLIKNIWEFLKSGRIELSSGPTHGKRNWLGFRTASKIWKNFLQRPFDIIVSLLLSVFFVAMFVAESTANVLSVNIVGDTSAIVSTPKCNLRYVSYKDTNAADYRQRCYRAKLGADGCNFFYNQSITYTEKCENNCPFPGGTCARESSPALTLDTGLIDAGLIGINSEKRYHFRRTTTCAPLKADGEFIKITRYESLRDSWNESTRENYTDRGFTYDFYGRRKRVSDNKGIFWSSPYSTIGLNQFVSSPSVHELLSQSLISHIRLVRNPAEAMPKLIDSELFPKDLTNSSSVSIFLFGSQGTIYDKYREDPVFPATSKVTAGNPPECAYVNNEPLPGILGCIDNTYVCDPELGTCWNYPAKPITVYNVSHSQGWSWPSREVPFKILAETEPTHLAQLAHLYDFPSVYNSTSGETTFTGIWDRAVNSPATEAELSLALLFHVLWGSDLGSMWERWRKTEAASLCSNTIICRNLPPDQWKAEARQLFETSLAQIQYAVLNTVRGRNESSNPGLESIPPRFRGLCKMGKFKSVGWRNVSVWGFSGLLSFAASVSLASVKTEEQELWLIVGFRLVGKALRWGIDKAKNLPWTYVWARVADLAFRVRSHLRRSGA